jgi:hypothetical protein
MLREFKSNALALAGKAKMHGNRFILAHAKEKN